MRGHLSEGRRWLKASLDDSVDAPDSVRARAILNAGVLAERQNDLTAALEYLQEAWRLFHQLEDRAGAATTLNSLAGVAMRRGDRLKARALFEQSLALSREVANPRLVGGALINLGALALHEGHLAHAANLLLEAESIVRQAGLQDALGFSLIRLAEIASKRGDYATAAVQAEEGVAILRGVDYSYGLVFALGVQGRVAQQMGDLEAAWDIFEEALELAHDVGAPRHVGFALLHLGELSLYQGDATGGRRLLERALVIYRDTNDGWGVRETTCALARVAHAQGALSRAQQLCSECLNGLRQAWDKREVPSHLEATAALLNALEQSAPAAHLFGAAAALRDDVGAPRAVIESDTYERTVVETRAALGSDPFAAAWSAGRGMSVAEAIATGLDALNARASGPRRTPRRRAEILTRREREVVRLVARGRSNREVADALVIAVSTVERHVANILTKLDLRSRTELALWAVDAITPAEMDA
jgi:DNA-binding NarL/FixJ family response regulator/Tfp pilus assembly protein PilF